MFEEKEKEVQKPGKAWKNSAYKSTYEEANEIRQARLSDKDIEVKVKWLPSMSKFVVKTRSTAKAKQS